MNISSFSKLATKGVSSPSLWLLLAVHSPNRYLASALLLLVAVICFKKFPYCFSKKSSFSLMAAYSIALIFGLFSFVIHFSSINNLFWSVFNFSGIISAFLITSFLVDDDILFSLRAFVVIESLVLSFQYAILAIKFKTIYVFSAFSGAGDALCGTLLGFSSPLALSLMMISGYFLFSKFSTTKINWCISFAAVSGFFSLFPGMMSGVSVFVAAIIITILVFSFREICRLRVTAISLIIIPSVFVALASMFFFLGENVEYMGNIFALMLKFDNPPIKILTIQKYFLMITRDVSYLWGTGIGNFTSRAALMVSGEYFEHQPIFIPVTPSSEILTYILPYWNRGMFGEIVGGSIGNSMINEPFNMHFSILAECGIIGFVMWEASFLANLVRAFIAGNRRLFALLIFCFGINFTNDWMAYPSFTLLFWMLFRIS